MDERIGGGVDTTNNEQNNKAGTLRLDYARYEHLLDDPDLNETQKRAFLEALWSLIVGFVDLGFDIQPANPSTETQTVSGKILAAQTCNVISSPYIFTDNHFAGAAVCDGFQFHHAAAASELRI